MVEWCLLILNKIISFIGLYAIMVMKIKYEIMRLCMKRGYRYDYMGTVYEYYVWASPSNTEKKVQSIR